MDARWSATLPPGTWGTERTLGRWDAKVHMLAITLDNFLLNVKLKGISVINVLFENSIQMNFYL